MGGKNQPAASAAPLEKLAAPTLVAGTETTARAPPSRIVAANVAASSSVAESTPVTGGSLAARKAEAAADSEQRALIAPEAAQNTSSVHNEEGERRAGRKMRGVIAAADLEEEAAAAAAAAAGASVGEAVSNRAKREGAAAAVSVFSASDSSPSFAAVITPKKDERSHFTPAAAAVKRGRARGGGRGGLGGGSSGAGCAAERLSSVNVTPITVVAEHFSLSIRSSAQIPCVPSSASVCRKKRSGRRVAEKEPEQADIDCQALHSDHEIEREDDGGEKKISNTTAGHAETRRQVGQTCKHELHCHEERRLQETNIHFRKCVGHSVPPYDDALPLTQAAQDRKSVDAAQFAVGFREAGVHERGRAAATSCAPMPNMSTSEAAKEGRAAATAAEQAPAAFICGNDPPAPFSHSLPVTGKNFSSASTNVSGNAGNPPYPPPPHRNAREDVGLHYVPRLGTNSATHAGEGQQQRGEEIERRNETAATKRSNSMIVEMAEMHDKSIAEAGGFKTILKDITLCAPPGQLLVIMGPSGSGKTTLLNALAGRSPPSSRVLHEGGLYYLGLPREESLSSYVTYVMQKDRIPEFLTVNDYMKFYARLKMKDTPEEERKKRIREVLNELGLWKSRNTLVGGSVRKGLSGGEIKRLAVAVELLHNPSVIFLDEPTSGLDAALAFETMKLLLRIAKQGSRTIICTIHQPRSQLFAIFDRLVLLYDGRVVYQGSARHCVPYFASRGFECPASFNPADFLLDLLTVAPVAALPLTCPQSSRSLTVQAELEQQLKHIHSLSKTSDTNITSGINNTTRCHCIPNTKHRHHNNNNNKEEEEQKQEEQEHEEGSRSNRNINSGRSSATNVSAAPVDNNNVPMAHCKTRTRAPPPTTTATRCSRRLLLQHEKEEEDPMTIVNVASAAGDTTFVSHNNTNSGGEKQGKEEGGRGGKEEGGGGEKEGEWGGAGGGESSAGEKKRDGSGRDVGTHRLLFRGFGAAKKKPEQHDTRANSTNNNNNSSSNSSTRPGLLGKEKRDKVKLLQEGNGGVSRSTGNTERFHVGSRAASLVSLNARRRQWREGDSSATAGGEAETRRLLFAEENTPETAATAGTILDAEKQHSQEGQVRKRLQRDANHLQNEKQEDLIRGPKMTGRQRTATAGNEWKKRGGRAAQTAGTAEHAEDTRPPDSAAYYQVERSDVAEEGATEDEQHHHDIAEKIGENVVLEEEEETADEERGGGDEEDGEEEDDETGIHRALVDEREIRMLAVYYAESQEAKTIEEEVERCISYNKDRGLLREVGKESRALALRRMFRSRRWGDYIEETWVLLQVNLLNLLRNPLTTVVQLTLNVTLGVFIGVIFFNIPGHGYSVETARNAFGVLFFVTSQSCFGPLDSLSLFCEDRELFNRDTANANYRPFSFFVAKSLANLPFQHVPITLFFFLTYWLSGLHRSAARFFIFLSIAELTVFASTSFLFCISCASPRISVTHAIAPTALIVLQAVTGYYVRIDDIPGWISWLRYVSFFHYAYAALASNQFRVGEMWGDLANEGLLRSTGGVQNTDMAFNVSMLAVLSAVYRFLAFLLLKYTNRTIGMEA